MAKLRQSLLPFGSKLPPDELPRPPDQSSHRSSIISKPPPVLSTELWDRILGPLGTFALKKFRLVCLQWSILGAERLYSAVYLNRYDSSWLGLISISTSCHASFVKKIVWNPLELPEECLDGKIWASRYQNLLRGLKHWEILLCHQAYVTVYRGQKGFWRSSKIETITGAINNLTNCHEIILSDDYDLETSCKDSYFRAGIRSDPDLLKSPTTWGLRPQMWKRSEDRSDCLFAVEDMFQALQSCRFITRLKIDFWAEHWNTMHDVVRHEYAGYQYSRRCIRTMLEYPHIRQLEFKLRFCELRWLWIEERSIQQALEYAIGCTSSFPELQELSFAPSFSEPEFGYAEFYQLESESIDDDDASLNTLTQSGITASELVTKHALAHGLTDPVLTCMYAELPFTAPPLPKLRMLRILNVTLDMRLLLYWLASHKQLPNSSISIHLLGTSIFYGLEPGLFLEALAQLNVRISYNSNNMFHYPSGSKSNRHIRTPRLECYLINGRKVTAVRRWPKDALHSPEIRHMPEPFPQSEKMATSRCAEFIHHPDELEQFIIDYAKNEYLSAQPIFYSYRISLDEDNNSTWAWFRVRTHLDAITGTGDQMRNAALVTLKLIPGPPNEDAFLYPETWSEEVDAGVSALEEIIHDAQVQREMEDQELLEQYETEFLGLDLIKIET